MDPKAILVYAKTKPYLKVVPLSVPFLHGCTLYNFEFINKNDEEKMYDRDKQLRETLTRGLCLVKHNDCVQPPVAHPRHSLGKTKSKVIIGIHGMPKFTHVDNKYANYKNYFLSNDFCTEIISSDKLDGKLALFSIIYINGEKFYIGGSKHVKYLWRNKEDLCLYKDAYEPAMNICKLCDTLIKYSHNLEQFILHESVTCIFEYLNPSRQYVINLSKLKAPTLVFLTYTSYRKIWKPNHTSTFYLPTRVSSTIVKTSLTDYCRDIYLNDEGEGKVLYFCNFKGVVIGMTKIKTFLYKFYRMIEFSLRDENLRYLTMGKFFNDTSIFKSYYKFTNQDKERILNIIGKINFENIPAIDFNRFPDFIKAFE